MVMSLPWHKQLSLGLVNMTTIPVPCERTLWQWVEPGGLTQYGLVHAQDELFHIPWSCWFGESGVGWCGSCHRLITPAHSISYYPWLFHVNMVLMSLNQQCYVYVLCLPLTKHVTGMYVHAVTNWLYYSRSAQHCILYMNVEVRAILAHDTPTPVILHGYMSVTCFFELIRTYMYAIQNYHFYEYTWSRSEQASWRREEGEWL